METTKSILTILTLFLCQQVFCQENIEIDTSFNIDDIAYNKIIDEGYKIVFANSEMSIIDFVVSENQVIGQLYQKNMTGLSNRLYTNTIFSISKNRGTIIDTLIVPGQASISSDRKFPSLRLIDNELYFIPQRTYYSSEYCDTPFSRKDATKTYFRIDQDSTGFTDYMCYSQNISERFKKLVDVTSNSPDGYLYISNIAKKNKSTFSIISEAGYTYKVDYSDFLQLFVYPTSTNTYIFKGQENNIDIVNKGSLKNTIDLSRYSFRNSDDKHDNIRWISMSVDEQFHSLYLTGYDIKAKKANIYRLNTKLKTFTQLLSTSLKVWYVFVDKGEIYLSAAVKFDDNSHDSHVILSKSVLD